MSGWVGDEQGGGGVVQGSQRRAAPAAARVRSTEVQRSQGGRLRVRRPVTRRTRHADDVHVPLVVLPPAAARRALVPPALPDGEPLGGQRQALATLQGQGAGGGVGSRGAKQMGRPPARCRGEAAPLPAPPPGCQHTPAPSLTPHPPAAPGAPARASARGAAPPAARPCPRNCTAGP